MEKNFYVPEYPRRMAGDQRDNKKKITFNKSMDSGDLWVICLVDAPAALVVIFCFSLSEELFIKVDLLSLFHNPFHYQSIELQLDTAYLY